MIYTISTMTNINEIISALGGTTAVAKSCNISTAAVSKWRRVGYIPKARLMYLELKFPHIFRNLKKKRG